MKIKLTISYDGSHYYGSQIQPDQITVHSKLKDAFEVLNIDTKFDFSGRTDKGVHAFRQVVSCEVPSHWKNMKEFTSKLNRLLPDSIYVRTVVKVDDDFHARFSAVKREYRYLISTKPLTPFNAGYMGYYETIDEELINKALDIFKGVHDFEYFSKKGSEPVSTVREIYHIKLYRYKDIYVLRFKANSYLRSQIRMMVDFIMKISKGLLTLQDLKDQLDNKKLISWTLASPKGLYLSKINY
ncbi:MAG: tRNA pseudouridine(38-40) synthase TruA [Campylobacterota bacterium]|nr:tRNA pseudouridine(38-40) synthase TruA [Campylobacterota bacterium]